MADLFSQSSPDQDVFQRILLLPEDIQIMILSHLTELKSIIFSWNYQTSLNKETIIEKALNKETIIEKALNCDHDKFPVRKLLIKSIRVIIDYSDMLDDNQDCPFIPVIIRLTDIEYIKLYITRISDILSIANLPKLKRVSFQVNERVSMFDAVFEFMFQYTQGALYYLDQKSNIIFGGYNKRNLKNTCFSFDDGGESTVYTIDTILYNTSDDDWQFYKKIAARISGMLNSIRLGIAELETGLDLEVGCNFDPKRRITIGYFNSTFKEIKEISEGSFAYENRTQGTTSYRYLSDQLEKLDVLDSKYIDGIYVVKDFSSDFYFYLMDLTNNNLNLVLKQLRIPLHLFTLIEYQQLLERYPNITHLGIDLRCFDIHQISDLVSVISTLGSMIKWTFFGYTPCSRNVFEIKYIPDHLIIYTTIMSALSSLSNQFDFMKLDVAESAKIEHQDKRTKKS